MELVNTSKTYNSDTNMVYSCQYHIVFTPKYRRHVLKDGVDVRMKEILLEKQEEYGYKVLDMEIMTDHVHLLLDVNPKIGVYQVITKIKGYTSKTLREEFPWLKSRLPSLWTRSKFISSVGSVTLEAVKRYIDQQKNI